MSPVENTANRIQAYARVADLNSSGRHTENQNPEFSVRRKRLTNSEIFLINSTGKVWGVRSRDPNLTLALALAMAIALAIVIVIALHII